MASRINKNIRWVQRALQKAGVHDTLEEEILDALNAVEMEILARSGSVKSITTNEFESDSTGIVPITGRLVHIGIPDEWPHQLEYTESPKRYEEVKREFASGETPRIVFSSNGSLYFWPIPTSGIITLYQQAGQEGPMVEGTGDPLLPADWDMPLRYGALAHLLPPGNAYEKKYEAEVKKSEHEHIQETAQPLLIDSSSRELGF